MLRCVIQGGRRSLVAFSRGILCNVLVCLAVWMGSAGKTVCDKLAAAILPVVAFVVLGFEHSVANMFFLPLGMAIEAMWGASSIARSGCFPTCCSSRSATSWAVWPWQPRIGSSTAAMAAIRRIP